MATVTETIDTTIGMFDGQGALRKQPGVLDTNGNIIPLGSTAGFQGVLLITPGTPFAASHSFGFICTTAGTVILTMANGSTFTANVVVSAVLQIWPFSVTNVTLGSGAAGSFWSLV
jgi:hypothetical protein